MDFHTKATGTHVALNARNSGAESGRELFKGSTNATSLLICTRKKNFWLGISDLF